MHKNEPIVWRLQRRWAIGTQLPDRRAERATPELQPIKAICALGSSGLGKTYEMAHLADLDRQVGLQVHSIRLAQLTADSRGFEAAILSRLGSFNEYTAIHLDGMDEAMVPAKFFTEQLCGWIYSSLTKVRPFVRISCRTGVWREKVYSALSQIYEKNEVVTAYLQPIEEADISIAAVACGVDPENFLTAVRQAHAWSLAQRPITLRVLLREFQTSKTLPGSRSELFSRAILHLASESEERREEGTTGSYNPRQIVKIGEQVACYLLLSGKDSITLRDVGDVTSLRWQEIVGLPSVDQPLDENALRALCNSGLCEGSASEFRFAHRQFAELLAASSLARLLPHQARSLLANSAGWRHGVAGPLREVAAFAANLNPGIARWVAACDPEVVGQSDVADERLRRQAVEEMFGKFRRHELTDANLRSDGFDLAGFKYEGAAVDLRRVLSERSADVDDLLEFAIHLISAWEIRELDDFLADLALDTTAPFNVRVSAGYVLREHGDINSRRKLKPLINPGPEDGSWRLKGLALWANWPGDIGVQELLAALQPRGGDNVYGAYEGFLSMLDKEGFAAEGDRVAGLKWANKHWRTRYERHFISPIAHRIARAAASELKNIGIVDALADLLLEASQNYDRSPLAPEKQSLMQQGTAASLDTPSPKWSVDERRSLLQALAVRAGPLDHPDWLARDESDILLPDDFDWLMGSAVSPNYDHAVRKQFAVMAFSVFHLYDHAMVQTWLHHRNIEPVASVFKIETSIQLGGEEEKAAREFYKWSREDRNQNKSSEPGQTLHERIRILLKQCEEKDFRFWNHLCCDLTLDEKCTSYSYNRFVTSTLGWKTSDELFKRRIVAAAKIFLDNDQELISRAQTERANSILWQGMAALWLIRDTDPAWISQRSNTWWVRWANYFVREIRPGYHDEDQEPIQWLFDCLMARVPKSVEAQVVALCRGGDQDDTHTLSEYLKLLALKRVPQIEAEICRMIGADEVGASAIEEVAGFLLRQDPERATAVLMQRLEQALLSERSEKSKPLAVSLLEFGSSATWDRVVELLSSRLEVATAVLGAFAQGEKRMHGLRSPQHLFESLGPEQAGTLVALLFRCYPPESDPKHDGVHWIGPDESARDLRDRLISTLGDQQDRESVMALRKLERDFGVRYSWLRRPRSRAERNYLHTQFLTTPPSDVAQILANRGRCLVRSKADALDAISFAIEEFERSLHEADTSGIEDLWNISASRSIPPTPKAEERASDKLCEAIRKYFEEYLVAAEREVQLRRRRIPDNLGGDPGSEVDCLVRVRCADHFGAERVSIPVEVKLSSNKDVKGALADQLAARYMQQLGTNLGVYVVMWMDAPNLGEGHRPRWKTIDDARRELENQSKRLGEELGYEIRSLVVDCSL